MNFISHFTVLKDPRTDINIKHEFLDILFLVVSAILSSAEGYTDIEEFGKDRLDWLRKHRPFANSVPSADTIARVLSLLPNDLFQTCYLNWVNRIRQSQGFDIISIDGKTLKQSYHASTDKLTALHSVSAYASVDGITLLQKKSKAKKNEVAAVLALIDELEIGGAVIVADAMSCLQKVTKSITKKKADYVLQLKANQAKLLAETKSYFHKMRREQPELIAKNTHETIDAGHGRVETRRYTQLAVSDWFECNKGWSNLRSVIEVVRTRYDKTTKKESVETAFYISSLAINPSKLGYIIRSHWGIENSLHYVLDVVFREDNSRIRQEIAVQNMASLRRFALALVKNKQKEVKGSIKTILKRCAWDDAFREQIIFQ